MFALAIGLAQRFLAQTPAAAGDGNFVEFILAMGALVALFWVGVVFLRGGLVGGSLLVLLAGSCFGAPFYSLPGGPLPITVDRLLLGLLLVQTLLYRRWGWIEPKPLTKADYLLGGFLLVLVLSTLTHDFQARKSQPLSQLLFFYLVPATLYWIVRQARFTERNVLWLFSSLAVFGVYLAATAIAETHQLWAVVFPGYIASPDYKEFFGRGRGPLLNPAGNGIVQSLGLCAALMGWPRLNRPSRLLLLCLVPLFAWGVYSTFTRSAWMGAGLGLLIVMALATPRAWRAAIVTSALLSATIGLALSWEHVVAFKRDKDLSADEAAESARLRPILAVVAWHMFLDRPLLGCGYGQYIDESPAYLSDRSADLPLEKVRPYVQHNVLLALLAETGLLGMGLFIAVFSYWTRAAWQMWRSLGSPLWVRQMGLLFLAFAGIYLPNAMFQDVSIIPMVNMILFFLAAAINNLAPSVAGAPSAARLGLWMPERELAVGAR